MKSTDKDHLYPGDTLTITLLKQLKAKGFRYVMVKAYMSDGTIDYISPRYILLIPMKELSIDPARSGVYEPIDSQILNQWAEAPHEGTPVLVRQG